MFEGIEAALDDIAPFVRADTLVLPLGTPALQRFRLLPATGPRSGRVAYP